jgi:hypothetical protein
MAQVVPTGQAEVQEQVALAEAVEQVELTDLAVQAAQRGHQELVGQVEPRAQAAPMEAAAQVAHQELAGQTEVAALAVRRGHQELAVQMVVQGLMEVRVPMEVQERRAQVARRGLSVQVERRVQMVQVVNHHCFLEQVAIQLHYH